MKNFWGAFQKRPPFFPYKYTLSSTESGAETRRNEKALFYIRISPTLEKGCRDASETNRQTIDRGEWCLDERSTILHINKGKEE